MPPKPDSPHRDTENFAPFFNRDAQDRQDKNKIHDPSCLSWISMFHVFLPFFVIFAPLQETGLWIFCWVVAWVSTPFVAKRCFHPPRISYFEPFQRKIPGFADTQEAETADRLPWFPSFLPRLSPKNYTAKYRFYSIPLKNRPETGKWVKKGILLKRLFSAVCMLDILKKQKNTLFLKIAVDFCPSILIITLPLH